MAQAKSTKERAHEEQECADRRQLVDEYRKVGPAAINAALLCQPKKKDEPRRLYEAREEA